MYGRYLQVYLYFCALFVTQYVMHTYWCRSWQVMSYLYHFLSEPLTVGMRESS